MTVHISGRGMSVTAALWRRVEAKVAKVRRFLPEIKEARVVLALERYRHVAEVTLPVRRATLRAEAEASDFYAALDAALENLEQQVRRRKERIRGRKTRPPRRCPTASGTCRAGSPPSESDDGIAPIEIRRIGATPMSVEEAVEQMRVRGAEFLVFSNAKTRVLNVLQRRADGGLELVEPGR